MTLQHLSASSVKTYQMCPRKWRYRYVDRLPEPPSAAMARGTLVHETVERYWRNEYGKAEPGLHRYVAAYRKMAGAVEPDRVAQVELKLSAELEGVDVPILGFLDLVTSDELVIDLKTAGRHWPSERAFSELPPALYTWLAEENGYHVRGFEFHILIGDGVDRRVMAQRLPVTLDESDMEHHLAAVRSAWRGIVAEEFPPRRQILCGYCAYQEVCRDRVGAGEDDRSECP